ncbi:hypothetical protein LCGC14_2544690, partial [marine sediment metagenome]
MTTEKRYEKHIEDYLVSTDDKGLKYHSIHYTEYDNILCLIPTEVIEFIKTTQETEYEKLTQQYGADADSKLQKRLSNELSSRGVIDVLRNGIKDRGASFSLIYFEPKSGLNLEHRAKYLQNRFSIVRQLHYSKDSEKSIDIVLFINGIPIISIELKNQLTGQTIKNADRQYRFDRNPKGETLLQFKRLIAHFSIDNDSVHMTTRLKGADTFFLPYNKDIKNPVDDEGYRVSYMWQEILNPNSVLDILENFVHIAIETEKKWDEKQGKVVEKKEEKLIFPRYHQLDVIRKLRTRVIEQGAGHNYLIQHTTGSGKSFEIGWLAHLITSLYRSKDDNFRIFDSVIIITDRKVLDKQLQNTVGQLEQTSGVVKKIDKDSDQLKRSLETGKDII